MKEDNNAAKTPSCYSEKTDYFEVRIQQIQTHHISLFYINYLKYSKAREHFYSVLLLGVH